MKKLYIETLGCQMNVLDSELVATELQRLGYRLVDTSKGADAILFNTCSVRQHAEDKIWSSLGRLKQLKQQRPGVIIGVLGCMAQREQRTFFKRAPHCDFILGPGRIGKIVEIFERVQRGEREIVEVSEDRRHGKHESVKLSFEPFNPPRIPLESEQLDVADALTPAVSSSHPNTEAESGIDDLYRTARPNPYQAMVRIQFGCNNFCTYCIVPYVRGPEQCRSPRDILDETRQLVADGVVEVTLIGQTVNAYRYVESADPTDDSHVQTVAQETRLAGLLGELQKIDGLRRIRFLTNYPREMTPELIAAVRDNDKVCPFFHVPAQSGSNAVLRRMNRHYTIEQYREMLTNIRTMIPNAAITSDFIVGFCGETEEEFQETAQLVREAKFRNSFVFKYSPRPGAKAAELLADDVPDEVKRRRNHELLAIQSENSRADQFTYQDRLVEILVEGPSKGNRHPLPSSASTTADPTDSGSSDSGLNGTHMILSHTPDSLVQLVGRTVDDRIVVFDGPISLAGQIVTVRVIRTEPFTLFAEWNA